jgi:protein-S-isoprenylcysteine O-methyltransferase Ste14
MTRQNEVRKRQLWLNPTPQAMALAAIAIVVVAIAVLGALSMLVPPDQAANPTVAKVLDLMGRVLVILGTAVVGWVVFSRLQRMFSGNQADSPDTADGGGAGGA